MTTFLRIAKGLAVVTCAWAALFATSSIPVWYSNRDLETIGRLLYCGLPIPWRYVAPGMAWAQFAWWPLPLDLAFWAFLSCLLFRVRRWPNRALCMLLAEAPLCVLLF